MNQEQLKTPGALQMIVNLLRRGVGAGDQQTPGRAMQIAPGRDMQIRAATGELSPEEQQAYEMQKAEALRRNQMLMGR